MKKRTEVNNQEEFDACVDKGDIAIVINCSVVARENSSVEARGNVFIRVFSCLKITASASVVILKHNPSKAIEGGRRLDIIVECPA